MLFNRADPWSNKECNYREVIDEYPEAGIYLSRSRKVNPEKSRTFCFSPLTSFISFKISSHTGVDPYSYEDNSSTNEIADLAVGVPVAVAGAGHLRGT